MEALISRLGGTPALVIKLVFLGIVNALAIWAVPALLATSAWAMLAVVILATIALDVLLLGRRFIPAKYVVVGGIFLAVFQLIPIAYTVSMAFTNYSTGHIGTREEAITTIERDSLSETEGSAQYSMLPLYDPSGELVLALTVIPAEELALPDPTDGAEGAADGGEVQSEFGPGDVQMEFGPGDATADGSGVAIETDMDPTQTVATGDLPPTYVGTAQGIDEVPPGEVERDEFGQVVGIAGYTTVPDADLPTIDAELASLRIPGPNGGFIVPQGLIGAVELMPVVTYDAATDTFTNVATGVVYVDNGRGSFANPDDPDDELLPGWRTNIGWENFGRLVNDPDVREPFAYVFAWTFAYAFLTVVITFFLGLGLAISLNRPGMRGQRLYRSLLIIPYAVPGFLSVLVWAGLLNDDFGALNEALGTSIPWLFDPNWAKVSALLVNVWLGLPYMFLISTGALQAIPAELMEAARVDGARALQVFRLVKLPLLLVALMPLLVASFAFNFNNFNNIYLLTGGGPALEGSNVAGATDILISYTYKIAFAAGMGNDFGLASAISIIIFLIVGTISAISFSRSKALREERS